MPSLSLRLEGALEGIDLAGALQGQIGPLSDLQGLLEGGPQALAGVERLFSELRLPDLPFAGPLLGGLGGALEAVPEPGQLSFADALQQAQAAVTTQLAAIVGPVLRAVSAVQRLLDADLVCLSTAPPTATPPPAGQPPQNAAQATAARAAAEVVLATLPSPPTVSTLAGWLAERVLPMTGHLPYGIGTVGDLLEPLVVLVQLDGAGPDVLRAHLAGTLQAAADLVEGIAAPIVGLGGALASVTAGLPADLATTAQAIVDELTRISAAATAADEAELQAAADALQTQAGAWEAHAAAVTAVGPAIADTRNRLRDLDLELSQRATIAVHALTAPPSPSATLAGLGSALAGSQAPEALAEIVGQVTAVTSWLSDLFRILDTAELGTLLGSASSAVDSATQGIREAVSGVAAAVAAALGNAAAALQGLDPAALAGQAAAALQGAVAQLGSAAGAPLAALEDTIASVTQAVTGAAAAINPQTLAATVEQAIAQIGAEIGGPDVLAALQSVGEALQTTATQLEALSFGPPVDVVVGSIDQVDTLLKTVGASLPAPAALALKGALSALPDTLDPAFDALTGQLGDLLEAGPIPLLEQIEAAPAQLRAQLAAFDPAALSGQLGGLFDGVVEALRAGSPARLVEQLGGLTAGLADQLLQLVDTTALVAPLRGPHEQLRAAVATLDPAALVQPLRDGLAGLQDVILEQLGVESVLAELTAIAAPVVDAVGAVRQLRDLLARVRETLATFPALAPGVAQWVDGVFAGPVADDGTIAAAAAALTTAANRVRAAGLEAEAAQAGSGLVAALAAMDPAGRLTALVAAHRAVPPLQALPASAARDAAVAALARVNPLAPAFAAALSPLVGLDDVLGAPLAGRLQDWDAEFHPPGGALADCAAVTADPATLLEEARTAAQEHVGQVLGGVLLACGGIAAGVGALLEPVDALLGDVEARLATLVAGPASLQALADAVGAAVTALTGIDLDVVLDAVGGSVLQVQAALDALSPDALAATLDGALRAAITALDPASVLGLQALEGLGAAYDQAVDALAALDPVGVLAAALPAAFDAALAPLLAALDLSGSIGAIRQRLAGLEAELSAQLERVDEAYRRLLETGDGLPLAVDLDIDIDLDVGIDVPSPF